MLSHLSYLLSACAITISLATWYESKTFGKMCSAIYEFYEGNLTPREYKGILEEVESKISRIPPLFSDSFKDSLSRELDFANELLERAYK